MNVIATIGLGANLNDPAAQVEYALAELDRLPGTRLIARSSLYASSPVGYVDQPDFINAVAQVETTLAPHVLLAALLDIEHRHGRERSFRNAPRTLDLDLLLYGDAQFEEATLTLPHPRMTERGFVLRPLLEIAPDAMIPGRGRAADWLPACADQNVGPSSPSRYCRPRMSLDRYRYIVVEGPIGAGKTSLTHKLAEYLGADTLLENASENPFLPRFYQEPKRYALPTQLHFLFERVRQIRELAQGDLFRGGSVSDFLIDKDMLFARLNLDDDEFELYQKVYSDLTLQAPTPDLVIYLQAPIDALQERVRRRGVEFERGMDANYLQRLANSYSEFFHRYDASPLLIVNTENLNFADNNEDFELLLERMSKMRGPREFFSRAA